MSVRPLFVSAAVAGAVLASSPAYARQVTEAVPVKKLTNPEPMPRRGFNVVLLLGDMQDPGGLDTVPIAARKALSDMKDFLPYKGYRLLDTQWVLASNSGPAITRLRGVDDQEFELELRASPTMQPDARGFNQTGISVRFFLREPGDSALPAGDSGRTALHPKELSKGDAAAADISREIFQLERERDDLALRVGSGRKKVDVGMEDPEKVKLLEAQLSQVNRRLNELKQSLSAATAVKTSGRPVIDTSFRMDDGETVVVGTSKVKGGGRALIALLTATTDQKKGSTK